MAVVAACDGASGSWRGRRMTTTSLPAVSPLLAAVLHGAALGGLAAAVVLTRARLRGWDVSEPWAITAAWTLLGAMVGLACVLVDAAA